MRLSQVIQQIKTYCPSFQSRVAGAAEFANLEENTSQDTPSAYVIPLGENGGTEAHSTGYRQAVHVTFGVCVICSARKDERGQDGMDRVELIKPELFRALLCWAPDENQDVIVYEKSDLLRVDRSRIFCQFEFGFDYQINSDDTWQGVEAGTLPPLETVDVTVKSINGDPQGTEVAHTRFTFQQEEA